MSMFLTTSSDNRELTECSSIRKSLQIGQPSCPVKNGCILEGELVVYSDKHAKVLDFHKIRKHVSRSGVFLGTDQDSQARPWEHLMIVYYDLLMVDSESLLAVKHSERFQRLKNLITPVLGRSALVKREMIDCTRRSAVSDLRRAFAKCITARGEGLVLKRDDPYFEFGTKWQPYSCCAIKLKKEYIGHFGDIGDFAVVGARLDAAKARTYNIPRIKWTHFYVGCLENKDEVQRFGKQPRFVVTNVVELNENQLAAFTSSVNPEAIRPEDNTSISLRIEPGIDNGKRPSVIFPTPPVFDLRCFSFDKEGNFWSPRFASVSKIHCDRTYHDAISFAELQEMAMKEKEAPPPEDSQELLRWIAALEKADPKSVDTTSQWTVSTTPGPTPSPELLRSVRRQNSNSPTKPKSDSMAWTHPAPVGGQLTPPRSSAAQISELTASSAAGKQDGAMLSRKRALESPTQNAIPERSKIRRRSGEQVSPTAALPSNTRPGPSTAHSMPLMDTQAGPSRRNTEANLPVPRLSSSVSMPQPESQDKKAGDVRLPMQTSMSFCERPTKSLNASPPNQTDNGSATTQEPSPQPCGTPTEPAQEKCRHFPDTCKFPTYSIILSPCIADFPWVADDLLSSHGVAEFLRDPKEWLTPSTQPLGTPSSFAASNISRRTKIALVDTRRKEATVAFLQSIEAAGLKRRNGEREYVPIYDWRVLETIREEERKHACNKWKLGTRFDLSGQGSVWRRFWVGLA